MNEFPRCRRLPLREPHALSLRVVFICGISAVDKARSTQNASRPRLSAEPSWAWTGGIRTRRPGDNEHYKSRIGFLAGQGSRCCSYPPERSGQALRLIAETILV